MIAQTQKPIKEILEYLDGKDKIVLVGCGGCATIFHTGGESEVKEMEEALSEHGKHVLAAISPPFGEFTCYAPWSKARLSNYRQSIEECDAILIMACGDGLQVVREFVIEGEFGLLKPIYPSTDSIGHMGGGPSLFKEKCQQCGECLVGMFAGICPLTQCAKGLLNGPCGGSQGGKCEVDPERDCAWSMIIERLEKFGMFEMLKDITPPKDWSKMDRPRKITVAPL
jgi:ferredoxin